MIKLTKKLCHYSTATVRPAIICKTVVDHFFAASEIGPHSGRFAAKERGKLFGGIPASSLTVGRLEDVALLYTHRSSGSRHIC